MKRYINIIINFILIFTMLVSLWGCGSNAVKEEKGISVYYIDRGGAKISDEKYESEETDSRKLVGKLLEKLHQNGNNENLSAIPENVSVKSFNITDGIAVIDFDENYKRMDAPREVLCRAAVVLTLVQVEKVDYVAFTINNDPLSGTDGSVVGNMKASDFVSDLGGGNNIFTAADFKLYFANADGSMLKGYVLEDAQYGEKSKEQFIVEQLIEGPKKKGYTATLSPKLTLINVVTSNNICYVNFADNFATEQSTVSNKLVIFSIVNSLSELNDVHKVQISINGDSALKYKDDVPLSEPFVRNLDIVENNE